MSKDKESICVTVRVRPLSSKELDEDTRICLRVEEALNLISMNGPEKQTKDFYFDSVCDKISQSEVFERVGKRSTVYCMEGYNCTIFAYGQTGAGKTFTMMGVNPESRDYFEQRGLIPRTLEHLFQSIEKEISESGAEYIIKCSFVEIYNEQIIDLLGSNSCLNIREDLKKGVYIEGVTEEIISQSEEAMEILRKGSKGRHVGSTFYNETSSRSHSVFTMQIQSQQLCNGIKSTKSRHFHFIDLAGSERTKKSMGDRLKEGCSINKSLHVLSMVISSLAEVSQGKSRHVNYRDSKLTFLLKDSLGGNSKTHLIANISPSWISSLETKSTLMFARKVKLIKVNKVSINEDASGNLESLKAEIRRLRSQNLILRNGDMSFPVQIQTATQLLAGASGNSNSKMVNVLQQYVDEELEKQTKMEMEISKLQNRNEHLQKGIKHYTENEKQLRMILAIYEDKIQKLKKAESLLYQKLHELADEEKIEEIKDYYVTERQILLEEIEKFKQLSTSSVLVKNLLRELKAIKENPQVTKEEDCLISVLSKNSEFLQEIKNSIAELEPEMQEGKASKVLVKQNEDLKFQVEELNERIEKYALEVVESKDKVDQTENLLNQAISSQISLEKRLENEQQLHQLEAQDHKIQIEDLKNKVSAADELIRNLRSDKNTLELCVSQYELQLTQINSQFARLKEKREFEELNFQEKIQALTTQNFKLQEVVKKRTEEVHKYKSQVINVKSESDRLNKQTEQILIQASSKIQELEESWKKSEGEKLEIRVKLQSMNKEIEDVSKESVKQKERLKTRNSELSQQIRSLQQEMTKYQEETSILNEKIEKSTKAFEVEKEKWEENHKDLMRVINEKKENESETQSLLTESKLEVISLNENLAQITLQYQNNLDSLRDLEIKSATKILDLEEQLQTKSKEFQHIVTENQENRRKLQILSETEHSLKRQLRLIEEQLTYKEDERVKLNEELQKIKKKEKEARILVNEANSQIYALKKNYEIETEALKQELRLKEDQVLLIENEKKKLKETHERSIVELQRKTQSEFEIFKQNEGSIKKAMEAHLTNKEKKISELKASNELLEEQLRLRSAEFSETASNLENLRSKLTQSQEHAEKLEKEKVELEKNLEKSNEAINMLETSHLKVLEEMENNFTQSLDSKNAEIEKLRRKVNDSETIIQEMSTVQAENNQLKSEIINRQLQNEELERIRVVLVQDLESIRNNGEQANHYMAQLETQLKERQIYIAHLNENMHAIEVNLTQQNTVKQTQIEKLQFELREIVAEVEQLRMMNGKVEKEKSEMRNSFTAILQEKEQTVCFLEGEMRGAQAHIENLTANLTRIDQEVFHLVKNNEDMKTVLKTRDEEEQKLTKFMELYAPTEAGLVATVEGVVAELHQKCQMLEETLQKTEMKCNGMAAENAIVGERVKYLEMEIERREKESEQQLNYSEVRVGEWEQRYQNLVEEIKGVNESNALLERNMNELTIVLERKQEEIMNLENHLLTTQRKAKSEETILNDKLGQIHEQSSRQVERLNQLYESSKLKIQALRTQSQKQTENEDSLRRAFELRMQQLQCQHKAKCDLLDKVESELNNEKERSEQLQKYIDEQSYKISCLQQQKDRTAEEVLEIRQQSEKRLKESEKRLQLGAAQMNSLREEIKLIHEEASVWKHRMQNLENEIRLSNDRAEKFRMEYMKQKQSNKEFKILLQNAQCQIDSHKNEAMDKDKLYHQLLEKVSKNDIERKGLMNQQDKKFSELLEKSRIEVSQMRKKYEDQLKINNLLKQELEKKDVDVSLVKQRSEEYCKKQQQLMDSIRSDYSKVENELKSVQNVLAENRKALKKVTLKNEELEEKILKMAKEHAGLESQNEELKKESLRTGMDERQMSYLNKLKEENSQLKRELERVSEEVIAVSQEKLRLKSEFRQGKDMDISNIELSKKISEVKYLQKIIDDSINVLGIRDYKKSVGESLKIGILELQKELSKSKSELSQLNDELCLKNQRLQILEGQKLKIGINKDEEDTLTKMRNKINKTTSAFESIRQSKEEDKLILGLKDPNKNNFWGMNRP